MCLVGQIIGIIGHTEDKQTATTISIVGVVNLLQLNKNYLTKYNGEGGKYNNKTISQTVGGTVEEKIALQLRLDKDIHERMKRIAKRERRSLNAQIEYVLQEYAENYEREHGDSQKR